MPQTELDTAYANARKNITDDAFKQELTRRGLTPEDMREGLRREMLTQKVIEQEVGSKITVTDQDVSGYFDANRAQFNVAEEAYHIAQIVITPVREPQTTNQAGDDAVDARGGGGEGPDADGAPQGRRVVPRSRGRLLGGFGIGAARRRPWAWCRCRS